MHVASLGVVPSVLVQSGAVRQRQETVEEHDAVEAVFVLKISMLPGRHPAGRLEVDL